MPDTITESELTAIRAKFEDVNKAGWNTHGAMRAAIEAVGITIVPDPIREPEGDVIVVDKYTVCWRKGRNIWIDIACGEHRPWSGLEGPVKIYRAEESV